MKKKVILDAYEKEIEQELEDILNKGLVKSVLTSAQKEELRQAAVNTLQREKKCTSSERFKNSAPTISRSISMPINAWKTLDRKRGSLSRGKFIATFVEA